MITIKWWLMCVAAVGLMVGGYIIGSALLPVDTVDFQRSITTGNLLQILATLLVAYYIGHALKVKHDRHQGRLEFVLEKMEASRSCLTLIRELVVTKNEDGSYAEPRQITAAFRIFSNSVHRLETLFKALEDPAFPLEDVRTLVDKMHEYKEACTGSRLTADRRGQTDTKWSELEEVFTKIACKALKM